MVLLAKVQNQFKSQAPGASCWPFFSVSSFFLAFLSTLFLQSNMPMLVLEDMWSNKMLNLGCFWFLVSYLLCLGAFLQHTGGHHLYRH